MAPISASAAQDDGGAPPRRQEIQLKVNEYATFLRQVLRPDYDALTRQVQDAQQEMAEYEDLRVRLEQQLLVVKEQSRHPTSAGETVREEERLVDLGHQKVFCQAVIDDTEFVYVQVGNGFHVELTLPEALQYIAKRVHHLSCHVLPHREAKAKTVLTHIRSSEMILDQLSRKMT